MDKGADLGTSILQLQHDQHLRLYLHWEKQRSTNLMPSRSEIDISQLGKILPHISLLEIVEGGTRYRVMGSRLMLDTGADFTGQLLGENSPEAYARALQNIVSRMQSECAPLFVASEYQLRANAMREISRLWLPLGRDHQTLDMILISRAARSIGSRMPVQWDLVLSTRITSVDRTDNAQDLLQRCVAWESAPFADSQAVL